MRCGFCFLVTLAVSIKLLAAEAPPSGEWVNISDPVVKKLTEEGKKFGFSGQTAGIVCDPANGDVYMIVNGLGIWKSTDKGATFTRVDDGKVGGRCETSFALNMDPAGGRLACFMLDGKCAITSDAGKTWQPMKDLGRNWDYAAVNWADEKVTTILGERHEVGGECYFSDDAGANWKLLFKDKEFDKSGGLGIFDGKILVRTQAGKGIERSTDAGGNWVKASDLQPIGRVMKVNKGTAYWVAKEGLLVSKDKGATWEKIGTACPGTIGPMFDPKDEKHMAVAGKDGIFTTSDAGKSWTKVAALPEKYDVPRPGWFTNVGWDPVNNIFYASKMGKPAVKWQPAK
jgi:photosystem II stability/assembly factor-like uncharacterized protein